MSDNILQEEIINFTKFCLQNKENAGVVFYLNFVKNQNESTLGKQLTKFLSEFDKEFYNHISQKINQIPLSDRYGRVIAIRYFERQQNKIKEQLPEIGKQYLICQYKKYLHVQPPEEEVESKLNSTIDNPVLQCFLNQGKKQKLQQNFHKCETLAEKQIQKMCYDETFNKTFLQNLNNFQDLIDSKRNMEGRNWKRHKQMKYFVR